MKFQAVIGSVFKFINPVITIAVSGKDDEYPNVGNFTIKATTNSLEAEAHNGFVAVSNKSTPDIDAKFECLDAGMTTVSASEFASSLSAFRSDEVASFEIEGNTLVIRPAKGGSKRKQYMTTAKKPIELPKDAPSYGMEFKIEKDLLLSSMEKVLFAIGFEKYRPEFLYWIMRLQSDTVRITCGDGSRFASYRRRGPKVVDISDKTDLLMFREQTQNTLPKVLPMMSGKEVTFKVFNSGKATDDSVSDQIVIEIDGLKMVLMGHDPGVKYPNEEKFLTRKNPYRVTTKASDWELPIKGVQATKNSDVVDQHLVHTATLTFDFAQSMLYIETNYSMGSVGEVPLLDAQIDASVSKEPLVFSCASAFLADMYKQADKDGYMQIEMLNSIQPVVVRFDAGEKVSDAEIVKVNKTSGIEEQYTIFFGSKTKK